MAPPERAGGLAGSAQVLERSTMSVSAFLEVRGDDVLVDVLVAVRASRTRILGIHGERVKVAIAAPPVDGAANKELVRFLARSLGVPRGSVRLVSGEASRRKRLAVSGLSPDTIRSVFESA